MIKYATFSEPLNILNLNVKWYKLAVLIYKFLEENVI